MSVEEYVPVGGVVHAERVDEGPVTVGTVHGPRAAQEGDYVVHLRGTKVESSEDGWEEIEYTTGFEVVSGEDFESRYELRNGEEQEEGEIVAPEPETLVPAKKAVAKPRTARK